LTNAGTWQQVFAFVFYSPYQIDNFIYQIDNASIKYFAVFYQVLDVSLSE